MDAWEEWREERYAIGEGEEEEEEDSLLIGSSFFNTPSSIQLAGM